MNQNNFERSRNGLIDVWNSFMCNDAEFTSNDIPCCPTIMTEIPKQIFTWPEAREVHNKAVKTNKDYFCDAFVCFYVDDQKFDGIRSGIWSKPHYALEIIKHFRGIITPDFSTYQDFPYPLKIYNTYRMRAFGYWIGKEGKEVINNIRWGTKETFGYCYDGIDKNSVVAIGTVGGSPRKLIDRNRFEEGLHEMMKELSPHTIVVYGSANYSCFTELRNNGVNIVEYKSQTAAYFERRLAK